MLQRLRFLSLITGALLLILPAPTHAQESFRVKQPTLSGQAYVPGEVLVKFREQTPGPIATSILVRLRATRVGASRFGAFLRVRIPLNATVEQLVEQLQQDPAVEYAEPNYIAHAFWTPNDALYGYQWHLDNPRYGGIHAQAAWDLEDGDPSVIVAVVDTGVAYEDYTQSSFFLTQRYYKAPDLAQTVFAPGYDFVNEDTHPNDDEGHGTHVTGTIAQSTNNGIGVAGIAFSTSIMPVKVLNGAGSGTYADVADGIRFAADHGAKVINMSLGGSSSSTTLRDALAYAYGKGVTIVCASGNNGSATTLSYPAAYDAYCLAVGATRYDETVSYYSNRGNSLDLVAPGGDTTVDQNGDGYPDGVLQQTFGNSTNDWGYFLYQGTSMATPHVSGVAALVIARGIATTPDGVRTVLQSTAEDKGAPGWDSTYGYGIVNAQAALTYTPPVPNQPPVASVGGPYAGTEDVPVSFDGSGSTDPDGDALTYAWTFGDGATGTGAMPSHTYASGGLYTITLVVNDGAATSAPAATTATITEVNDLPVANAGPDQTVAVGQTVNFNGSGSFDLDGSIASYAWDFGDGSSTATGVSVSHAYAAAGSYTVTLTVTDNSGVTAFDTAVVTVSDTLPPAEVFNDSFEISEWNNNWTEDAQNDWYRSTQRAASGRYSAEVDGSASDAQLISIPINLQGRPNATITFSWYIESSLDTGEYLAFDVSTDGGAWLQKAIRRGNVDPENVWQAVQVELPGISNLRLRFRGKMSSSIEDADVDSVKVVAH